MPAEEHNHVKQLITQIKEKASQLQFQLNQDDWSAVLEILENERSIKQITLNSLQGKINSPKLKILLS